MSVPARLGASALLAVSLLLPPSGLGAQEVPPEPPGTISVHVAPDPFSPNGDGRRDRTTITVEVSVPSRVEVQVVAPDGTVERTWSRETAGTPAVVEIRWDGTAGGRRLPDRRYAVRAAASILPEDPEGLPDVIEGETTVTLDTRPPAVAAYRVSPTRLGTGRSLTFRFRATDRAPLMTATLTVRDATRRIGKAVREVSSGASGVGWRSPRRLYPGNYRTVLRVRDDAGNVTRARQVPWRVERPMRARVYRRLNAGRRVALTFDDCHNRRAWGRILRTLRRTGVEATFFCPGARVLGSPDLARRTARGGHTPGSHAWDHASLAGRGAAFTAGRLRRDARAWWKVARVTSAPYMRPPYGAYDAAVVRASGEAWHPRVIMWDVDPQDWRSPGSSAITSRVVSRSRPGSIILLHTVGQTAAALPSIVKGLRRKGLEPVSLPVLFRAAGMP